MRDFLRLAPAPALLLLLGACAATAPATPAPPAAQGAPRAGVVMPPARGVTPLVVRTAELRDGTSVEVAGAACEIATPYTTARFASPASVALPDLGAATPAATVTCVAGGKRGAASAQPATRVADTGMSGWPAIGVSVGAGTGGWSGGGVSVGGFWNGGSGNGAWTEVVYPDVLVILR